MPTRAGDLTLELDTIRVVVNPRAGASICSLEIRDDRRRWAPVLRTMPRASGSSADAGSFVMVPWTNRIRNARFGFQGEHYDLMANHRDGTAIHGVGRDLPWTITDRSPVTARLVLDSRDFAPGEVNYPFAFGAIQRFEIGPRSLGVDLSVTNLDQRPIPVGCGHHPYFHRHLFSDADELRIRMDLSGRYPAQGCIPTDEPVDDEVCARFREGKPIGNPGLDDVFAGFGGQAVFDWPENNVRMTVRCDGHFSHMVVYTPRNTDGSAGEFVCIEPVSMVNDGFNRLQAGHMDTGVMVLGPGETMRTRMELIVGRGE